MARKLREMVNVPQRRGANLAAAVTPATMASAVAAATHLANLSLAAKRTLRGPRKAAVGTPSNGAIRKVTSAPVRLGYATKSVAHSVVASSACSTRVRGLSYIAKAITVSSSGTYNILAVSMLNPAWFQDRLGIMARTFDKYVYHSIKVTYVPNVGSSTNGVIRMYVDRDAADPPADPNVPSYFMSAEGAVAGPAWEDLSLTMRRDSNEKRTYFTNFTAVRDVHESEQFRVVVAGQGLPSSTVLGDIIVEYDLELIAPVFAPTEIAPVSGSLGGYLTSTGTASFTALSFVTTTVPFGLSGAVLDAYLTWEIIILDFLGSNISNQFTIGYGGALMTTINVGSTYYIRLGGSRIMNNTPFNYTLYPSLDTAVGAYTQAALYNFSTSTQNLFTGNVLVAVRPIGINNQLPNQGN